MNTCLLCKSNKIKNIQKIKTSSIINLYQKELNIDVKEELFGYEYINALKCANCKLVFFNPIIAGSEKFYENLQKLDSVYYSDLRPEFLHAIQFINKSDTVLEIGSGSAHFAEKLNNKNYVGLEYNQEAIDKAAKKGIILLKQSIEEFAEKNHEKFDVVCSFHVLEHVTNPYTFIESSLKTLKKGGTFICAVPCSNSFLTSNHNHVLNIPPHHISRWNSKTFEYVCEEFNLSLQNLYNDKISNNRNYFELKVKTTFFNFFIQKKQILINDKFIKIFDNLFKKINRFFSIYKFVSSKNNMGQNIMIIATKN